MEHLVALQNRLQIIGVLLSQAEQAGDLESIGNLSWDQMCLEDRIARIQRKLRRSKSRRAA